MRVFNKPDKSTREEIVDVCKKIITKVMYYFFKIIYLGTASFRNGSLFTPLKENAPLIKQFGPMYIHFDEYLPYISRFSECFGEINVNENVQCVHGYAYSSGKHNIYTWVNEGKWVMMKTCFHDAKQIKMPKNCFRQRMYISLKR